MAEALRKTPLNEIHRALGGQMVPFAGWEMPLRYKGGGDMAEHNAVRQGVGLFDVSHMGRVIFSRPDALRFVDYLTINNARALEVGQVQYSAMCYPDGGMVDDILVYRPPDGRRMLMVINAGNRDKDLAWMREHRSGFAVRIEDVSDESALLALQGPKAPEVLAKLNPTIAFREMKYYHFGEGMVDGVPAILSRTGYTGEDGFEFWIKAEHAPVMWNKLLEAGEEFGILPCGLGARDSLRLEAGYCLYGHEISEAINPLEAGLGWITKIGQKDFIGREALREVQSQDPLRRLAGFRTSGRGAIPRQGDMVLFDDNVVGSVVSGVFSPTLEVGIGTGFLMPAELARTGNEVEIIRGEKRFEAEVLIPPRFYRREKS